METDVRSLDLAATFDIHVVRTIDEDIRHRGIGQQRLQRAETHHFVLDLPNDVPALHQAERRGLLVDEAIGDLADLRAYTSLIDVTDHR